MSIIANVNIILVYILAVVVFIHSFKFRGLYKTLFLLFGTLLVGLAIENMNSLYGGYRYPGSELTWFWGNSPFDIGLGWFVIIYCSSYFSHILIGKCQGSLPTIGIGTVPENGVDKMFLKNTILRAGLAGAIAVSFDMAMDPLAVKLEFWIWEINNIYIQGVPLGNYIGWFLLVFTFLVFHDIIITYFSFKNSSKQKTAFFYSFGCIMSAAITGLILMGLVYLFGLEGIRTDERNALDLTPTPYRIEGIKITLIIVLIFFSLIMISSFIPEIRQNIPKSKLWRIFPSIFMLSIWCITIVMGIILGPEYIIIALTQALLLVIVCIYLIIRPYTD
ncbi:MAG: carotenoid biosynthesis protein [Promethearchaeota archaeon]